MHRILLLAAILMAASAHAAPETPADMILTQGQILTPEGWAEAMAVRSGVIVAIGSAARVDAQRGPHTQVIGLGGATVLPGMHDMHAHPLLSGRGRLQCHIEQGSSAPQLSAAVRECARSMPSGGWIVGGQWDAASLGRVRAHRRLLDEVAPGYPVVLHDISGHAILVSTKALELAGVTRATPDPERGLIEHDARGEPTGVLREAAVNIVRMKIPAATVEEDARAIGDTLERLTSFGITSITDALVDEDTAAAYAWLSDHGQLKVRVRGCLAWLPVPFSATRADASTLFEHRNLYRRERFVPDCVKIVLDGVPTDGHTAALLEPYVGADPADPRARGMLMLPTSRLQEALVDFDRQGLAVKFHAAGDAAVHAGLDAIEAARRANGPYGRLHDVGHNSLVAVADLRRGRALGATFEMSPYFYFPTPIMGDIAKALGPERLKRWMPVRDALDAGALVVSGSDIPPTSPWPVIEGMITRHAPGGGGDGLGEGQRITLPEAIDLFTGSAARHMGHVDEVGTLMVGKMADLVVLDRNPFQAQVLDIHLTQVKLTMIAGEIVYRRP